MSTHSGSEGKVFVGTDQVAEIKSWSLEITSDVTNASVIGTAWQKNQATIKSFSGSFDGFWDDADADGQGALIVGGTVTLNMYAAGNDTGDKYWSGDVIITSIGYNAAFDGLVEASFSYTGTGALTQQTVA